MTTTRYELVATRGENEELTLDALAQKTSMHPSLVEQFLTLGIIEPSQARGKAVLFDTTTVVRLRAIARLRKGLGVNCAGAAVILDLVDKLRTLQLENRLLRSRSGQL